MVHEINATEQAAAIELHAKLATIEPASVRRDVKLDRSAPRKELAAAVRKLFRSLGLKGISVTAPNYSMASSIDVSLPKRADYVFDRFAMVVDGDVAREANSEAARKIDAILFAAFPSHRDRSDSQSDHFDFKFSVQ